MSTSIHEYPSCSFIFLEFPGVGFLVWSSTSRCDFANCASKMLSDGQRTPRYPSHVVRQGGENPPLVALFQAGKRSRCVEPLVKRSRVEIQLPMDQVAITTKQRGQSWDPSESEYRSCSHHFPHFATRKHGAGAVQAPSCHKAPVPLGHHRVRPILQTGDRIRYLGLWRRKFRCNLRRKTMEIETFHIWKEVNSIGKVE